MFGRVKDEEVIDCLHWYGRECYRMSFVLDKTREALKKEELTRQESILEFDLDVEFGLRGSEDLVWMHQVFCNANAQDITKEDMKILKKNFKRLRQPRLIFVCRDEKFLFYVPIKDAWKRMGELADRCEKYLMQQKE